MTLPWKGGTPDLQHDLDVIAAMLKLPGDPERHGAGAPMELGDCQCHARCECDDEEPAA